MNTEPVGTIGGVFVSLKLAITALMGVIVIGADLRPELAEQLILAVGLIVIAVGDIVQVYIARQAVVSPSTYRHDIEAALEADPDARMLYGVNPPPRTPPASVDPGDSQPPTS